MLYASWSERGPTGSSRGGVRLTFANVDTLDQLLLRRFGGKVRRGLTAELSRRHDFPIEWNFALPGPHGQLKGVTK